MLKNSIHEIQRFGMTLCSPSAIQNESDSFFLSHSESEILLATRQTMSGQTTCCLMT